MGLTSPGMFFEHAAPVDAVDWQVIEQELLAGPEVTSAHLITHDGQPHPAGTRSLARMGAGGIWGHVPVPWGIRHPRWGMVTRALPITPLDARPLRRMPGGARMPGTLDALYQELLVARASVVSYGPSTAAGRLASQRVQSYADAIVATSGSSERADARGHGRFLPAPEQPHTIETLAAEWWPSLGDEARGCAFIDSTYALVCQGGHASILDLHSRRVTRTFAAPPLALHGVLDHHAVFDADGTPLLLDLRTGQPAESAESGVWGMAAQAGAVVVLQDVVRDAGVTLVEVGRQMARQVFTPDRQWVWVISDDGVGAVYHLRTGLLTAIRDGARRGNGPHALALDTQDRWCCVDGENVWLGELCLGSIGAAKAVAFNTEGSLLLVERQAHVEVLAMAPGLPAV